MAYWVSRRAPLEIEGDGSIGFSMCNKHKPKPYPRLNFMIVQKHPAILHYIQKMLGFGQVQKHGPNAFRYSVSKRENQLLLCFLLNGNVTLKKKHTQIEKWCTFFALPLKPRKTMCLDIFQTAWLSGFVSADGCFNIKTATQCRFIIDQKNEIEVFSKGALRELAFNDGVMGMVLCICEINVR